MNGVALAFIAFVALVLQSALAPRVQVLGVRPDWLLVFVTFLGLYARPGQAVFAALALGACADLLTIERFGLLAVSYGLGAAVVASIRDGLFRFHPLTHVGVTLALGLTVQTGWLVYRRGVHGAADNFAIDFVAHAIPSAVYTATWALPVHGGLLRLAKWVGVGRPPGRLLAPA